MTSSGLQQLQARFGQAIDREVMAWLTRSIGCADFSGMMQYQLGYVDQHFHRITTGTGKRFRPVICLLAAEAVGGDWQDALPTAAAVEILHNFSLVHDDIEDRDPSRRHRPTVWKVWGEPRAINVGDGMFAVANRALLNGGATLAPQTAPAFQEMALALTEGQYMDMSFEVRQDVAPDEYLRMIRLKTGALIAFSLWAGACVGGAADETRHAMREFGEHLGKAFQIRDDIMGIWGAPEETGKQAGKDLDNRKKTLPLLLAVERAGPGQRDQLTSFLSRRTDDVKLILDILNAIEARTLAQQTVDRYLDMALSALTRAEISSASRKTFESLARELCG